MTRRAFFTQFEKHLLVGNPKREEILHELRTHGEELSDTAEYERVFGNPKIIAERLNRTHIGFFHTPARLFGIPLAALAAFSLLRIALYLGPHGPANAFSFPFADWWPQWYALSFFFPFIAAVPLARTIARLYRAAQKFAMLSLLLFFSGVFWGIVVTPFETNARGFDRLPGDIVWGSLSTALLFTLFSMAVGVFTMYMDAQQYHKGRPLTRRAFYRDALFSTFASVIIFFSIRAIAEMVFSPIFNNRPMDTVTNAFAILLTLFFCAKRFLPYLAAVQKQKNI